MKVLKALDYTGDSQLYVNLIANDPQTAVRFPPQELQPRLRRGNVEQAAGGETKCRWQAAYDLREVPPGESVDLIVEYHSSGQYLQRSESGTSLPIHIRTPTAELTLWILLPSGEEYKSWRLIRYRPETPHHVERVKVVTEYLADDYTILAFKLLSLKPDYIYEVQWYSK